MGVALIAVLLAVIVVVVVAMFAFGSTRRGQPDQRPGAWTSDGGGDFSVHSGGGRRPDDATDSGHDSDAGFGSDGGGDGGGGGGD